MKRRIHEALLGIVGLAGVAFFALSGVSCGAPVMQCAVGHGPFAVVYTVTSGDAACYEAANKTYGGACSNHELYDDLPDCAGLAKVDQVGFSTFLQSQPTKETVVTYDVDDDKDPATPSTNDDDDASTPDVAKQYTVVNSAGADYNKRKIAVQSAVLGALAGGDDPTDHAYGFGEYTNLPDENDLCYAGTGAAPLSLANVDIMGDVHLSQQWSDVRFFVTAGVPGTQVVGKMKFDNVTDDCSVEYTFTGLYPSVFCGSAVMGDYDDDGDPMTSAANDTNDDDDDMTPVDNDKDDDGDDTTPVDDDDGMPGPDVDADDQVIVDFNPDDLACDPRADPAAGRVFGSGINPDFQTFCHPELLHCVLKDGTGLVQ